MRSTPGRRRRFSPALAAGAVALLAASALALFPGGWPQGQSAVEKISLSAAGPWLGALSALESFPARLFSGFGDASALREENRELRERLAALELESAELRARFEAAQGRLSLREMVPAPRLQIAAAPVIALGPAPPARTLILGKGSADGIGVNMAALAPPGVAGVVRRVTENQALVQLAADKRTRWGARAGGEKPARGVIEGLGEWDRLLFVFENVTDTAEPGERVYTSGTAGSLFPSGLPVGEIINVRLDKNGRRVADVAPRAQVREAGEVYVILAAPEPPDPALLR